MTLTVALSGALMPGCPWRQLTPPVVGLDVIRSLNITGSVQLDVLLSVPTSSKRAGSDAYVRPIS